MTICYRTIKTECTVERQSRTAYGVEVTQEENGTVTVLARIPDITPDKSRVDAFCALCNRETLSPIHICDAVEDFILA